jgi:predicted metalloendopeptidase
VIAPLTLPDIDYYVNQSRYAHIELPLRMYISTLLNWTNITTSFSNATETIIGIERALSHIMVPQSALRDPVRTYNRRNIQNASALAPALIGSFFRGALDQASVLAILDIVITTPLYFAAAEVLVQDEFTLRDIHLFVAYQYIHAWSPFLSSPFRKAHFALFGQALRGTQAPRPRTKQCLGHVKSYLGELLSRYYIARAFDPESSGQSEIESLVSEILASFESRLDAQSHVFGQYQTPSSQDAWMDTVTHEKALKKLHAMVSLLGYVCTSREAQGWI